MSDGLTPAKGPVLVCGMGHVGFRIVEVLLRLHEPVVVITSRARDEWRRAAEAAGARVILGDARDEERVREAGLQEARALLAVTDDDVTNLEIALDAKRMRPDLPVVIRLLDQNLAQRLEESFDIRRALSVPAIAAPAFARAAIGDDRLQLSRKPARRMRRLAPLRWVRDLYRLWRGTSVGIRAAFLVLNVVIAFSVFVFSWAMKLSLIDALYFTVTTVTTVGYGDITPLKAAPALKLYGCVVMLLGSATLATLTSIVTGFVVTERFEKLLGRRRVPTRGHVIVVGGLGNVGSRTVGELTRSGFAVAVIDLHSDGEPTGIARMQSALVVGDARQESVLREASVGSAHALLAVTGDDAVNLGVGLLAKKLNPEIRTVIRLFDASFAEKVETALNIDVAMGASRIAAPVFVEAALG